MASEYDVESNLARPDADHKAKKISYAPTEGLSYDPNEARYWDKDSLRMEVERTFEVCHGCRMCFKYCDSFPRLFDLIDNTHDGDAEALTPEQTDAVVDDCFQCKLCEVQCPYTPREGHEFQLDFPKLLHRYKAVRAKDKGIDFRDRVLGNPDGAAKAARASFGMANKMNRVGLHRVLMEKTLGIHRNKLLPDFASSTFESWANKAGHMKGTGAEVVLFQTCYVQNNEPQIGRDTLEVFEKNQVPTTCEKGLACCGMPAWESGDLEGFRRRAKKNLDLLEPHVEAGAKVVVINPTCSMMLRQEYPELVGPEDKDRALKVADAIRDAGEFLWGIRKEERFNEDFKSGPKSVAYHAPCHLRAQAVGFRGRDLLRKTKPDNISMVMECCGHDGTYAMKKESYEASARIGKKSFDGMHAGNAETWVTDCPLAAIQFEEHAGVKPIHPMTALAKAYRGDTFEGIDSEEA